MKKIIILLLIVMIVALVVVYFVYKKPNKVKREPVLNTVPTTGSEHFGIVEWDPLMSELGFSAVNIQRVKWGVIEPKPPVLGRNNYLTDPAIKAKLEALSAAGVKIQIALIHESDWALDNDPSYLAQEPGQGKKIGAPLRIKPEYLNDWTKFVTHLVTTYPISYIQVGNEPENAWSDWPGYVESLCLASEAAKKVNPNIKIVMAGFNMGDLVNQSDEIINRALSASPEELSKLSTQDQWYAHKIRVAIGALKNGGDCFDVLSFHFDHNKTYDTIQKHVTAYKKIMNGAGYDKPIWLDNMGSGYMPICNTQECTPEMKKTIDGLKNDDKTTIQIIDSVQSSWLIKKTVSAFAAGIDRVYLVSPLDWTRYFIPIWQNIGLVNEDGQTKKPSFFTTKMMIAKIGDFVKVEKTEDYVYVFTKPDQSKVVVAWGENKERTIDMTKYFGRAFTSVSVTYPISEYGLTEKEAVIKTMPTSQVKVPIGPVFIEAI